jgi:hypothetical protein
MTKEQYLSIVASWKQYIRDGKHKKYKVHYWMNTPSEGYRWESDLTACHHLLYALIRNKDLMKGFQDNETLLNLVRTLKWVSKQATPSSFANKLLVPFGEQFTFELLKEVVGKLN